MPCSIRLGRSAYGGMVPIMLTEDDRFPLLNHLDLTG